MFWKSTQQDLEKHREYWLKTSAQGKRRFILLRGVLGFGGTMCIFFTVTKVFIDHDTSYLKPSIIPIDLLVWSLAGYSFGVLMWERGQKFLRSDKGLPE
jgi:hypothetical protein